MADNFVKVYEKILDSSIWGQSSDTRIVWITMLAMSDAEGNVAASIGGIARRAAVSLEAAQSAIQYLESPDEESPEDEYEGRRIERVPGGWVILKRSEYRDKQTQAQQRTAERVRNHRRAKSEQSNAPALPGSSRNGDVTPCNAVKRPVTPEKEEEKEKENISPPTEDNAQQREAEPDGIPDQEIADAWNALATEFGLTPCHGIHGKRRKALAARWKEKRWRDGWKSALDRLRGIRWIRGDNQRGWKAHIDWFLRPEVVTRILEGQHDDNRRQIGETHDDDDYQPF
jgi:hypothetical protein